MEYGGAESLPYLVFIGTNSHWIDPTDLQFPEIELTDHLTGKNPQGLKIIWWVSNNTGPKKWEQFGAHCKVSCTTYVQT
jgi:hypothetical protein